MEVNSMEKLQQYPAFSFAHENVTDGRIILVDEPIRMETRYAISSLDTVDGHPVEFIFDQPLAKLLEPALCRLAVESEDPLFVFCGNGSNFPRRLSQIWRGRPNAPVAAKRFWRPGSDPFVLVGTIQPERFLVLDVSRIIVVDDVISSGMTLNRIYRNNAWRFPRATWHGAAWVAQLPRMKSPSGVNGYETISVSSLIRKRTSNGRVPINSLSTLRCCPDIAQSYAARTFVRADDFLALLGHTDQSIVASRELP